MVGFGDILRFDPEQIEQIFDLCSTHRQHCDHLGDGVKSLSNLHTWSGDAADAAKNAAGKTRVDLDAHGREAAKVAAAARDCYGEGVAVRQGARNCQAEADALGLAIDPISGKVSDPHPPALDSLSEADRFVYHARILALQTRVSNVIAAAERFDDDLAAAINAADGAIPTTPHGEDPLVNLADRQANQVAAFRQLYGRDPVSQNDWRMAEAVDPHTYDPKTRGALSNVIVARMQPSPGHGVTRGNFYIPSKEVQNLSLNPWDLFRGHQAPHNFGDNRGPDKNAAAESSRMSIFVDHESGLMVARQNPTVVTDYSHQPRADTPKVRAVQGPDGSVRIAYSGTDYYQPLATKGLNFDVQGDISLQPHSDGTVTAGGRITSYPSAEIYHYSADGSIGVLADYEADPSQAGPATNLPLGPRHNIGAPIPQIVDRDMVAVSEFNMKPHTDIFGHRHVPNQIFIGTNFGSATAPPQVAVGQTIK